MKFFKRDEMKSLIRNNPELNSLRVLFHCGHFDRNEISFWVIKSLLRKKPEMKSYEKNICACEYKGNILFELLSWNSNCDFRFACLVPKKVLPTEASSI